MRIAQGRERCPRGGHSDDSRDALYEAVTDKVCSIEICQHGQVEAIRLADEYDDDGGRCR